ncbi:MAG: hypothetical protein ACT4NL_17495 [Pseudomarimonas sp.]
MTKMGGFLILLALSAGAFSSAALTQARKQWRPATMTDIERQQARTGTESPIPDLAADAQQNQPIAQQAYVDPLTDQLISRPSATEPAGRVNAALPGPAFALQRTSDGFLYVDTSAHRHMQTVVIHGGGKLSKECSVWSPWSDPTHASASGPQITAELPELPR